MIQHILFDLDNTLYSINCGIEDIFLRRLKEYTSSWLGITWEECEPIWRAGLKSYGTTLEWLIEEKGFNAKDEYYAYIHPENEADTMKADPELRRFIEGLPCRSSILTNSPLFHAERIIKKLELEGVFQYVFSIEENGLKGKPHASFFYRALDCLGLKSGEALFIDDIPRYVEGYIAIGGKGLLLDERDKYTWYANQRIKDLTELSKFLE
jgi:putative hydrolase of the HAD superfamily